MRDDLRDKRLAAYRFKILSWVGFAFLIATLVGCAAAPPPATPTPIADPYKARLYSQGFVELVHDDQVAPVLPPNPSQADQGADPYRQICMACHGNWGQGLTEEWRASWGEDSNCWQSKCHASNHPPQGFELPRTVPPLSGPGALSRYQTAADLYQNIVRTMPWWNPGSLSEEQAWALTAFLMRARGELGDDVTLNAGNAPIYRLRAPYQETAVSYPGALLLLVFLLVAMVALVSKNRG